ncbi:hypothetical protein RI129_005694 [Pyrocoelia pectoralis]|uniref:Protein kintoun n=1 Tax=Pyrocoelia pectoralis TaxID=417401 RepID=A0AAN7VDV0_9COLE
MARSFKDFKELDLNRDEVERLTEALKDKNFRKLLTDYVDEVRNPENQKLYQEEITQLERERGIDVTFINPVAGYVIKTSVDGDLKAFINICCNEHVSKPFSSVGEQDGSQGRNWTVPHVLAPPRDDYDKKMVRCQVFDVVFHPETLQLAHKFKAFREMVNKTACDAVEKNFNVSLDRKNLRFPKIQFKGMSHATVIRRPSKEPPTEFSPEEKAVMDEFYDKAGANYSQPRKVPRSPKKNKSDDSTSLYSTPKYIIKHCRHVEMDEFTEHKESKMNVATPKELVIEIDLPLLRSSADITLDVTEKSLQLTSETPAKYNLFITLPYYCNHDCGNAKFVKDKKKLIVTLPVILKNNVHFTDIAKDDSGVDSDPSSLLSNSPSESFEQTSNAIILSGGDGTEPDEMPHNKYTFLDHNLHYCIPDFAVHIHDDILSLTLNVKNVDTTSIEKFIGADADDFHIKFCSVSSGFYAVNYAFYLKLLHHKYDVESFSMEPWDNNLLVQMKLCSSEKLLDSYLYGLDKENVSEKHLLEAVLIENSESKPESPRTKIKPVEIFETTPPMAVTSYSESSGDEIGASYSPCKSKGILKGFAKFRQFGRSISESGLDDVLSLREENIEASYNSVIPEEQEVSTSLKKTVRFNDVVSRQLFRSNSIILEQRKKKNWRTKAKKRAQRRRHSESEVIDQTKKDYVTHDTNDVGSNNDIFQLEIN